MNRGRAERPRLVLASGSPRRREILRSLGLEFAIRPTDIPEDPASGETPDEFVVRLALDKFREARPASGEIVIAADTIVVLNGDTLGKPATEEEAREVLGRLRARAHQVKTALAVGTATTTVIEVVTTTVWMREYSDEEIEAYIARGEPFDKAGGYAIQDEEFHPVDYYQGCPMNVMGLPVCRLAEHLRNFGIVAPVPPEEVCRTWFGEGCRKQSSY